MAPLRIELSGGQGSHRYFELHLQRFHEGKGSVSLFLRDLLISQLPLRTHASKQTRHEELG